jgi:hypothetical protein
MIAKGLVVLDPSRHGSWDIQRGHHDHEDLPARSRHPLQQSVAGDASVTGVHIAPIVTVTCGHRGLPLRLAWFDPGFMVVLGAYGLRFNLCCPFVSAFW